MSRCFPFPPPGYEKGKNISSGEGEAEESQLELGQGLGYLDKNAKKDKKEKKKKREEKNKDEHKQDTEKSEKKHKHKHDKHRKDTKKEKDSDHNKQKNMDDVNNVLTRDENEGHAYEGKNGAVDAKGILNKEEPEYSKFSENIEDIKCGKTYPSESDGPVQKVVDKERKSEVELRKFAGIDRHENGKCDRITLLDKESSRQKVDKNKQLESRKPAGIESLKNGKYNKTDLSISEGSSKVSEYIENRKCGKIYPSDSDDPMLTVVDKERKSEAELRKFAAIDRHENGKCDIIALSNKENSGQKVHNNKQLELESKRTAGIKSLKNGKYNKTDLSNKEESSKFSENIENRKCGKIYPSESDGPVQKLDKEKKTEVELRKFVGIDRHENGKCDMIALSEKENSRQKVDRNKQLDLESRKPAGIESLNNGKRNRTDLSTREESRQKVAKDMMLKSRIFAGAESHENGKCDLIDLSGREATRNEVEKDKKLKVKSKNSAGIERLKDGKSDKTDLVNEKGSIQQENKEVKLEVEMVKSAEIERHQNGTCDEIATSAREGSKQNMDKDKKLEVNLKKHAGIGRLENEKCDKIGKSDREGSRQKVDKGMTRDNDMERDQKILKDRAKSNGVGKKRKEMDTTSSSHVKSIERLKNPKRIKIDQSDRQGSTQKVIKETVTDNEIARDKENSKDLAKSEGITKKRKEMDTTSPSHGNGLWIQLPVLTDKDKWSIKRPQIETTEEVYCGNGTTVQEANCGNGTTVQEATDPALGCAYENGFQNTSESAVEKCIASSCHLPVATKDCEQNDEIDSKTISHTFGASYWNAEAVDVIPSTTRVDNHVQDFNYFHSVPPKLDWSHVDDQDWLFQSNGSKPKAAAQVVDHGLKVWAQKLQLEPNIYALPYVLQL